MPEFEVAWAPLTRKWQVWEQQLDQSGCMVETLIGEYSSEGHASHEAAIQRGEIAAESVYQAPPRRRRLSLSALVPMGISKTHENQPDQVDKGVEFEEREVADAPVARITGTPEIEPESVVPNGGTTREPDSLADTDLHLRTGSIAKLEATDRRSEFSQIEHLRRLLREALDYLENGDRREAA